MLPPILSNNSHNQRHPGGFTLMEIVVAMGIFMVVSLIIAEIFVNVQRAQQRLRDNQVVATELRYLMDVISREVRSDKIDYSPGACASSGSITISAAAATLNLCTSDGTPISFRLNNSCFAIGGINKSCVEVLRNSGAGSSWQPITSQSLTVDSLTFWATPLNDPFPVSGATASTPDVQPRVTIALKVTSLTARPADRTSFFLQTSVTSRTYAR